MAYFSVVQAGYLGFVGISLSLIVGNSRNIYIKVRIQMQFQHAVINIYNRFENFTWLCAIFDFIAKNKCIDLSTSTSHISHHLLPLVLYKRQRPAKVEETPHYFVMLAYYHYIYID